MVNLSKFVKEHIPLCVCTLGIAILGYLGYRGIQWIIHKCQRTEKVDHVAKKNMSDLSDSLPPKPLIDRVSNLEISSDKITVGQGEYVVFHKLSTGEHQELSRETFEQVYKILTQYSPATIINSGSEKAAEECANRFELIKAKVKELDSSLEIVFVPRTLYELIFIRKCIKEDLKNNEICPFLNRVKQNYIYHPENSQFYSETQEALERRKEILEQNEVIKDKRKCWHLCYFDHAGDNEHVDVKKTAYRLNQAIIKTLSPSNTGFTYQELSVLAEKEIHFLKAHFHRDHDEMERLYKFNLDKSNGCRRPGPTLNFGYETTRDKPMGIRHETDAQIIRDAIALDCSKIAQKSFFLYRGADFQKDSVTCWSDKDKPYSLSYGTSLFAGCLFDGGAAAFHYMRNGKNAYALPIPFDQINDSPFYIPPTNTIAQLFGDGEIFHGRTKAWKNFDVKHIGGISLGGLKSEQRDHLRSNLTQTELTNQFLRYKSDAFQIK